MLKNKVTPTGEKQVNCGKKFPQQWEMYVTQTSPLTSHIENHLPLNLEPMYSLQEVYKTLEIIDNILYTCAFSNYFMD